MTSRTEIQAVLNPMLQCAKHNCSGLGWATITHVRYSTNFYTVEFKADCEKCGGGIILAVTSDTLERL